MGMRVPWMNSLPYADLRSYSSSWCDQLSFVVSGRNFFLGGRDVTPEIFLTFFRDLFNNSSNEIFKFDLSLKYVGLGHRYFTFPTSDFDK